MPLLVQPFFIAAKKGTTITFSITPQTVNSDGSVTPGTTKSLRGQCKSFEIKMNPMKEEVSSVDSPISNNLILAENGSCNISEMQLSNLNGNFLANLVAASDYFGILFGYAHVVYGPFYCSRGEFSDGITTKGNGALSASFDLVDFGQTGVLPVVNT